MAPHGRQDGLEEADRDSRALVLSDMHPKTEGILESLRRGCGRSARFYEKIFGFRVISDFGGAQAYLTVSIVSVSPFSLPVTVTFRPALATILS